MQVLKPAAIMISSLVVLFFACSSNKKISSNNITRISVNVRIPVKYTETQGEITDITVFINSHGEYLLYELPTRVTTAEDNVLLSDSIKYDYVVQHKDSSFGYKLEKLTDTFNHIIKMDSSLAQRTLKNQDVSNILKTLKINSRNTIENSKGSLDTYYFTDDIFDSAHFYYAKDLKNIPYSLSLSLDSLNNAKLYKVELFTKKENSAIARQLKDFNVISWSVTKLPITNEKELMAFFERFKNLKNN